jgi:hypothetical protein
MDLSDMIARCSLRYQDENNDQVSEAGWVAYLNDAYRDVLNSNPLWPFLKQTNLHLTFPNGFTEAYRSQPLPTDVFKVTSVYNVTEQYPMRAIEGGTQHIRLYPDQTLTGVVQRYRVFNNTLEVWPLPEETTDILLDYIIAPPDLDTDPATVVTSLDGGVPGDFTVTDLDVNDTIISCVTVDDTDHSLTDITADASCPVAGTLNIVTANTTGTHIVLTYSDFESVLASTPVFPAQWHNILVLGALSMANVDDQKPQQAALYQAAWKATQMQMVADLTAGNQDRNPEFVDNWY